MQKKLSIGLLTALAALAPSVAHATNITEFPDNGSEQMARGGAWAARASDPLAAYFNPAGLAGQRTGLTLQANISTIHTCFTRIRAANDESRDPILGDNPVAGQSYPRVCNDIKPFLNPQIGATYRVNDRIGIGLAVLPPSGIGSGTWPTFISNASGDAAYASPSRYMLIQGDAFQLNPTLGIGVEVIDNLRLGASFTWGIFKAKLNNGVSGQNIGNASPDGNDLAATVIMSDYFVPAVTLGAIYTVGDFLDIAGTFKWQDTVKASGNLYTQANYFTKKVRDGDRTGVADGDTSYSDCNYGPSAQGRCSPDSVKFKLAMPMEAKLAFRYHKPRAGAADAHMRDPIKTDVFDAEVDFTWANNSAIDNMEIRFPGDANGNGVIPINGTPGFAPPNSDIPRHYKDVFGIRAGGDYNLVPDKLALRGGVFFETNGQDVKYQNIDFVGAARFGVATGATYRLRLGAERKNALEFHLGFMHVFYQKQQNDDPNGEGVHAIAGTACNPAETPSGGVCSTGRQKYRTNWPVNLGSITNALNVINVGATYRF
ncbi:OmpP1/FadL family transporter [Pendulispora albinea]|uniref:Outer membrane protein transport protein n=1 Tax=Pendulispora albinea TaxID=2741071 RepID=A0ABZ2LVE3_9BACT